MGYISVLLHCLIHTLKIIIEIYLVPNLMDEGCTNLTISTEEGESLAWIAHQPEGASSAERDLVQLIQPTWDQVQVQTILTHQVFVGVPVGPM